MSFEITEIRLTEVRDNEVRLYLKLKCSNTNCAHDHNVDESVKKDPYYERMIIQLFRKKFRNRIYVENLRIIPFTHSRRLIYTC